MTDRADESSATGPPERGRPGSQFGGSETQTGVSQPGLRQIFVRPRTRSAIVAGVALYLVFGVGYAILAAGIGVFGTGPVGGDVTGDTAVISVAVSLSPLLAVALSLYQSNALASLSDAEAGLTAAVTNAAGVLTVFVVGSLLALGAGAPGSNVVERIGESVAAVVVGMVAAAFVAAGTVWVVRRFSHAS